MTALSADVVVLDLEGTTSAAGFILGDLYDYARPRLEEVLSRACTRSAAPGLRVGLACKT